MADGSQGNGSAPKVNGRAYPLIDHTYDVGKMRDTFHEALTTEEKGPKVRGLTYKNKTNQRRRYGHRQRYATVEIQSITKG